MLSNILYNVHCTVHVYNSGREIKKISRRRFFKEYCVFLNINKTYVHEVNITKSQKLLELFGTFRWFLFIPVHLIKAAIYKCPV